MTRPVRRAAGAITVAAFLLAACGASATPAPSSAPASGSPASSEATPAAPATAATPATAAPTTTDAAVEPIPSTAADATAAAALGDGPLEDLLPSTFDGATLQKLSFSGSDAVTDETTALLAKYGKSPADVTGATAFGDGDVVFVATRVAGLGEDAMREMMAVTGAQGETKVEIEQVNLAGRSILKTTAEGSAGHAYFYVRGDTAFGVVAPSDEVAAKALAVLP
jgi:hypothetical protein